MGTSPKILVVQVQHLHGLDMLVSRTCLTEAVNRAEQMGVRVFRCLTNESFIASCDAKAMTIVSQWRSAQI